MDREIDGAVRRVDRDLAGLLRLDFRCELSLLVTIVLLGYQPPAPGCGRISLAVDTPGGYSSGVTSSSTGENDLLARLRRIEGQVRGIARMVENDQYCTPDRPNGPTPPAAAEELRRRQ